MAKTSGRFSRYPAVNRDGRVAAKPVVESFDVAGSTVDEVLAWVGDDEGRRAEALAAEQAGKQRKSLLDALSDDA